MIKSILLSAMMLISSICFGYEIKTMTVRFTAPSNFSRINQCVDSSSSAIAINQSMSVYVRCAPKRIAAGNQFGVYYFKITNVLPSQYVERELNIDESDEDSMRYSLIATVDDKSYSCESKYFNSTAKLFSVKCDLNGNGYADENDFDLFMSSYSRQLSSSDLNRDGYSDVSDLAIFAYNFHRRSSIVDQLGFTSKVPYWYSH